MLKEENGTPILSDPESAERKPDLGKFKSVDALLHAYEELEAEFTRRSQRLRALEERNKEAEAPQKGQTDAPLLAERDGEELYRSVMENRDVRARIVGEYLQSLQGVPLLMGSGTGVTAPVARPKSFAEAGSLALGCFKSRI